MVFQNNVLSGASGSGTAVHTIDQSIRFNDDDSAYMSRTFSASNRKTLTFSCWVKRGNQGTNQNIFGPQTSNSGSGTYGVIRLNPQNELDIFDYTNGTTNWRLQSTQLLRDSSAWYNFVFSMDTSNAVSTERLRMYINGQRVTDFDVETYPSLNYEGQWNNNLSHEIGAIQRGSTNQYFDGYLAEIVFIDGQALDPSSFGETNSSGIWVPKDVSGLTFGTNGFHIDGRDSSDLGDDESGNGNDFTTSGLASNDQVADSPTNNFCTINPIYRGTSTTSQHYGVVSNGNLFIEHNGAYDGGQLCTQLLTSGKWYWEVYIKAGGNSSSYQLGSGIGAVNDGYTKSSGLNIGNDTGEIGFNSYNGQVKFSNSVTKTYSEAPFSDTDIIQIAVDADNGAIYYGKNGTFMGSGDPTSGASKTNAGATWTPASYSGGWVPTTLVGGGSVPEIFINFGQEGTFAGNITAGGNSDGNGIGNFKYSVPSGYLALCTKNLGS